MNAAVTAALIAAQQSGELPDVVVRLTEAKALAYDKAVTFKPRTKAETEQRDELIGKGLVKRRGDGRLYVDQRELGELNARAGYGFLIALLVLASVAASVIALVALT